MQKNGDIGELQLLKVALKKTFSKIKQDTTDNSNKINNLDKTVLLLSKELKQIKLLLNNINSSIKNLNNKNVSNNSNNSLQENILPNSGLKTEVMRRLKRNKRSVIKQKIINVISSGQYTLPEIKDIIVDENNYCSKASFYRYFDELKNRNFVEIIEINDLKIIVLNKTQNIIK